MNTRSGVSCGGSPPMSAHKNSRAAHPITRLITQVNMEALERAARSLVRGKYELDARLTDYLSAGEAERAVYSARGLYVLGYRTPPVSIEPRTFAPRALPFCDPVGDPYKVTLEWVDPFLVLGGTWQPYARPSDEEAREKIALLTRVTEGEPVGREADGPADYTKIGALPLYVAREGKNRVLLHQQVGLPVRARVSQAEYPEPEELTLHRTVPCGVYVLACNNQAYTDRHARARGRSILPFPELVVPLLEAYGVRRGRDLVSFLARGRCEKRRRKVIEALMD